MLYEPKCWTRECIHFIGIKSDEGDGEENERNVCNAFPDGIPDEIAYGDNLHTVPFPGQSNEIVYQKK